MTDARLLATNPENSSLVPVACNAQGQLLVNDVVIEGIDNDVTVNGELTVTSSAEFSGSITAAGNLFAGDLRPLHHQQPGDGVGLFASGAINIVSYNQGNPRNVFEIYNTTGTDAAPDKDATISLSNSGSASFASGAFSIDNAGVIQSNINSSGIVRLDSTGTFTSPKVTLNSVNGSATFAGGNAGITKEGHLYVKTVRGNIVMLDAVSNGLGSWIPYEPPSRKDLVQEKLQEWSEKDKPSETDVR